MIQNGKIVRRRLPPGRVDQERAADNQLGNNWLKPENLVNSFKDCFNGCDSCNSQNVNSTVPIANIKSKCLINEDALKQNDLDCTLIYSNLDSFLNKKSELLCLIEDRNASIIALTEIKAKRQYTICEPEYNIPGFDCFINPDPQLGVALYIKESLHAVPLTELNNHPFNESV